MLSDRMSSIFQTFLAALPPTVWRLVLSDQADHVVGVVGIDSSCDDAFARLWNVEGEEIARVARSTPIRELVDILLRAQCTYIQ